MTTAIALGTILIFALAGYFKGLVPACLDLASAVTTVILLVLFVRPAAGLLLGTAVASAPLAYVAAAAGIVLSVAIVTKLVAYVLRPVARDEKGKPRFRSGGAAVNAMAGSVWAVLLVWGVMLFRGIGTPAAEAPRPFVEVVAGQAVGAIGSTVLGRVYAAEPLAGPAAYQMLKDPGRGARGVRAILQNDKLKEVFADPGFVAALQSQERTEVLAHPRFKELLDDPAFSGGLADMGLAASPEIASMTRAQMADAMLVLYARAEALESDPEVQATLNDPAFKRAVEAGDIPALLSHPGLKKLLKAVAAEPAKSDAAGTPPANIGKP